MTTMLAGSSEKNWLRTFTGKRFYPTAPTVDVICIEDIAHGLANLCRFAGQCRTFYSVAQHSIMVSKNVPPEDALWGLMHDAAEAYVVDIPRGIKHLGGMGFYRDLENGVEKAICEKFGLDPIKPASVKLADLRACKTEARDLMSGWEEFSIGIEPYEAKIVHPMTPETAEAVFLDTFWRLRK